MELLSVFLGDFVSSFANINLFKAAFSLLGAFGLGLVIQAVYRRVFCGVVYSRPYGISLVLLSMLTAFVILPVTANVVLSLGMVGALSIVRFRTAIKDPLDLVFLFWAIGTGIIMGAGLYPLALLGAAVISAVMLLFVRRTGEDSPYILIVHARAGAALNLNEIIGPRVARLSLRSRSLSEGETENIFELRLRAGDSSFLDELDSLDGVRSVSLVSYDGEYAL